MANDEVCEYFQNCIIFKKFKSEGGKNIWIRSYCKGPKMEQCARRISTKEGKSHPITLLPNGKHLATLAFDDEDEEI